MALRWTVPIWLVLTACARAVVPAEALDEAPSATYEVTIFDNFEGANVRVCFRGVLVRALVPVNNSASSSLKRAWSETEALPVRSGRVELSAPASVTCIGYETRFADEVYRTRDGLAVVVSQSQWLWRPEPFPPGLDATVSFLLPTRGQAALPFEGEGGSYVLSRDAFFRDGYNVFGVFPEERFEVGDTVATIVRLGPNPGVGAVRRWLEQAMLASASVGDAFPSSRVLFVVVPIDDMDRPVLFGMIRRGGGASVILLPSSTAETEALEADWVAIHELSHLWLPRLYGSDRWLTEGIATYLQEVLRARCGLQSEKVSWERIADGLERGRRAGTGRTLSRESRDMNRTGAYHRVYWAGTAFALEADIRLRQRSAGEMTLLRALALAQPDLRGRTTLASAADVLSALDRASGSDFLSELGALYASSSQFPRGAVLKDPTTAPARDSIMVAEPERCRFTGESSR